ncbi:hypothetical protein A2U01_0068763, partial [Trifolium medium]|nr:hypothetical protein [Trifolium medium]
FGSRFRNLADGYGWLRIVWLEVVVVACCWFRSELSVSGTIPCWRMISAKKW